MRNTIVHLVFTLIFVGTSVTAMAEKKPGEKGPNKKPNQTIAANCSPPTEATELDINNTRALIQTGGDMWWDFQVAQYEIPAGTRRNALFAGSLWLGGQDVSGQLKVAAQRFRSNGNDFWTGPLSTVDAEISPETCREYDRHWVTTRDEVTNFVGWYEAGLFDQENGTTTQAESYPGYSIPNIMYEWPAHGRDRAPFNEDFFLAPFTDRNGDGFYNPDDGDYPAYDLAGEADCRQKITNIYGDQNLWWVFNDKGNVHTETGAQSIGMEIRAQAFAFATNDEVNNMTFYNYELVNRSTFTLTETYFGVWVDADLGFARDDFVGCDVNRGLGYCYNGDNFDEDQSGQLGYGEQPPAIGVDFFQGPFQDPDGVDNQVGIGENEALNGVGYGDNIVDNERFGMRRFLYHNNTGSGAPIQITDPETGTDYYNYLRGIWKDGSKMVYGGDGYDPSNQSAIPCDFMFPGDTDPQGWGTGGDPQESWTEESANNTPFDRRFAQSAGPFTLEPGAVNNITVGVVWARATAGGPFASVQELRRADDKTQALFDNCFQILNGPDAPDVTVQELDKEILIYLSNPSISNNANEDYTEENPFLIPPDSVDSDGDGLPDIRLTDEEKQLYRTYRFQGYQLYQLVDGTVGADELDNPDKSRLIAQVDLEDEITQLVNFEFNEDLNANEPKEVAFEIEGSNEGVRHSFRVTTDEFASGDNVLVNHKTYYFMAVAYGFNNFGGDFGNLQFIEEDFDPNVPEKLGGQKEPYLASRKAATGPIRVVSAIPHKTEVESGGAVLNSGYGDELALTRIEGRGNGGRTIEIDQTDIDRMFATDDGSWTIQNPTYVAGRAPIQVKVVDPLAVQPGTYTLRIFDTTSTTLFDLNDARWELIGPTLGTTGIVSDKAILIENEQLLLDLGLSVTIEQIQNQPGDSLSVENGLISSEIVYQDEQQQWLTGLEDDDGLNTRNWIRSGTSVIDEDDPLTPTINEPDFNDYEGFDDEEVYESILGGTWAPFRMVSNVQHGPSASSIHQNLFATLQDLHSVEVVFTSDKSKWTRSPVIETHDLEVTQTEGNIPKGFMRAGRSIDKDGNTADPSDTTASNDPNDPNFISATGMGWFPGYAINVETGERLNIAYGEDSWLEAENGRDMLWNPTSVQSEGIFQDVRYGGKHYIYIFRKNENEDPNRFPSPDTRMPVYDEGRFISERLKDPTQQLTVDPVRAVWSACTWVSIPMLVENQTLLATDATVRINVSKPYATYALDQFELSSVDNLVAGETYLVNNGPIRDSEGNEYEQGQYFVSPGTTFSSSNSGGSVIRVDNSGLPMYQFSTDDLAVNTNVQNVAEDALDLINIVPNPYYAYSQYETDRLDNRVKITNLPQTCTITIYTVNGTLVRTFQKDDPTITSQDWDLKNFANIPIASGMYLIHVEVPGVGEKVLKWFGVLRPTDLDSF